MWPLTSSKSISTRGACACANNRDRAAMTMARYYTQPYGAVDAQSPNSPWLGLPGRECHRLPGDECQPLPAADPEDAPLGRQAKEEVSLYFGVAWSHLQFQGQEPPHPCSYNSQTLSLGGERGILACARFRTPAHSSRFCAPVHRLSMFPRWRAR